MPTPATKRLDLILLFCLVFSRLLSAQEGSDPARISGVVSDLDDRPVPNAKVELHRSGKPGVGALATTTDENGRWAMVGMPPGRWEITIKAPSYRTSKGWVDAGANGAPREIPVALRPLAEITPIFATSSQSISNWIEMGNDLLEQGHLERARQEYEKALAVLPVESQPEVLRAVARTHYLEGSKEETMRVLERALLLASEDDVSRELYRSVSQQLDLAEQAEKFLSSLADAGRPEAESSPSATADDPLTDDSGLRELPIDEPRAGRTGRYRTRFDEVSPIGDLGGLLERLGIGQDYVDQHDPQGGSYELIEESFQVYAPDSPAPVAGYGLLIWVSPLPEGGFTRDEVRQVLDEEDLIWIGADRSGNRRPLWYRVRLALDAVHNASRYYEIDEERVYAAGYSGGGRITSLLAQLYSEVFRGGFSLFGCDYWQPVSIPHMPGAHWPPAFPPPTGDVRQAVKSRSRFVLLTGELDFNRSQTKATYERMVEDGFDAVELLVIPGASHYHPVDNEWIRRGIEFLDGGQIR